ncbi:MAG: C1 family peptidase [Phycisphaerae bacterium]|nr:C1 family peptidase [Phycisphaerae bacterium]
MKRLHSVAGLSFFLIVLLAGRVEAGRDEVSGFVAEKFAPNGAAQGLKDQNIEVMQKAFDSNSHYRQMQNAATVTAIDKLALNRKVVIGIDNSFSCKLDDWSVTDQKMSGRCWIFAGTNLLRVGAMKKMNLTEFEFSQSYIFFWDKIERANYFLESIIDTAAKPDGDRTVDFLLDNVISDGGQWDMFIGVVKKYGLVPKSAMPESESSSHSYLMNKALEAELREGAKQLRDLHSKGATAEDLQAAKQKILSVVYRILSIHMGTPPKQFDWQWRDKDNEFHRDGLMTPQEFAKKYITLDLDEYVCLVNDPRPTNPFGRTYTVAYLGNIVGGKPVRYLNVDIDTMKNIAMRTLLDGEPVWFGCDCSPHMESDLGLWDAKLFDYEGVYGTSFNLNKAARLIYHQSRMNHAMLFTGVDVVDNKPRRWRVENSWSDEKGKKGFFIMDDSWFDEFMFEVAAKKSYLPENLQKALELEPVVLPPWDPMGSLAN